MHLSHQGVSDAIVSCWSLRLILILVVSCPQELARALWALGTLRAPSRRLLHALCNAAQGLLPSFNSQDLANSVWALGTLRFNPGGLMHNIALHAAARIDEFEPKVCSLLWCLRRVLFWAFCNMEQADLYYRVHGCSQVQPSAALHRAAS